MVKGIIVFVVTWFAGLFYLPRLFVYHALAVDQNVRDTLKVMQRKLMIMTHIGGALAIVFGLLMLANVPVWLLSGWMQIKLGLVLLLLIYQFWCALLVKDLARDEINHSHQWFRWFNEFPTVILVSVVLLAVLRPF